MKPGRLNNFWVVGETAYLDARTPSAPDAICVLDAADVERAVAWGCWRPYRKGGLIYIHARQRGGGLRPWGELHRVILGLRKGAPDVDHRNRDRLDNRRGNLRSATDSQNGANKSKSTTRSHSKFKGVTFHRNTGRWQAAIKHHDRCIYLGLFDAEENAARAYDHAALRIFGEFARPNFPEDARP